jgi:DAACS family dicarboxylate/amino acid:cation (Na+ or H+) symporter
VRRANFNKRSGPAGEVHGIFTWSYSHAIAHHCHRLAGRLGYACCPSGRAALSHQSPAAPMSADQPPPSPQPVSDSSPPSNPGPDQPSDGGGIWHLWHATPLYLRILAGCGLGVLVGLFLGQRIPLAFFRDLQPLLPLAEGLAIPSQLVLRLLGALAAPLILLAVIQAIMHAQFPRGSGMKLVSLLLLNTLVAILIGLFVANTVRPGAWTDRGILKEEVRGTKKTTLLDQVLENVPRSVLGPLTDGGKVMGVIFLAIAFGVAFRRLKNEPVGTLAELVDVCFRALITILHWIIEVIPLAVFGIVARIIAVEGFHAFVGLGAFVIAVLIALALQMAYYLTRIRFASWARPMFVLRGVRDALVMAFSTASSTATMPVTYACLREKVGLRERSASLGALVGANFNNDGTALYEAMAALFISQLVGKDLTLTEQILVVLTSIVASVGAAGIPEAGIVTMTLVFNAVGLKPEYIPLLLTVDWFLDRCRTAINVMGDVNVSCILDGKTPEVRAPTPEDHDLAEIA